MTKFIVQYQAVHYTGEVCVVLRRRRDKSVLVADDEPSTTVKSRRVPEGEKIRSYRTQRDLLVSPERIKDRDLRRGCKVKCNHSIHREVYNDIVSSVMIQYHDDTLYGQLIGAKKAEA